MRFHDLGLLEPIVRAVAAQGYTTPTPIQEKAIPQIIAGNDVLGCAQTGTGKTGAFALPILHRLAGPIAENGRGPRQDQRPQHNDRFSKGKRNHKGQRPQNIGSSGKPRALVLCPTRELASQILDSFVTYGKHMRLKHTVVYGGVSQHHQVRKLRAGVDVLVATPGRLLDLINQRYIDLSAVEVLVLDEADRMLDMGFIPDIRKVIEQMPSKRQTLLFSATMPKEIRRLADAILRDPITVEAAPEASTADAIAQYVYKIARKDKPTLLTRLLGSHDTGRTLVFSRTKHGADKLVKALRRDGIEAGAIHGNKTQNARMKALQGFKSGKIPVLVATDIASRGIDVDQISHVINFDMPNEPESYIHRIGRTARAGASGIAISFCDHDERGHLKAIERKIRMQLEVLGDHPDLALADAPTHWERKGKKSSRKSTSGSPRKSRGGSRSGHGPARKKSSAPSSGRRR